MAKLFYQNAGAGFLNVYEDPLLEDEAALTALLPQLQEVQALSDSLRGVIAQGGIPQLGLASAGSLEAFDDALVDEIERVQDILDYFSYETRVENLTVRDGLWITPVALESVSDENVGEEGVLAVDQDFGTWWQSDASGLRSIVFRVRDHRKMVEGLRLRCPSTDERCQLQGVTVRGAAALALIDDPGNVLDTNVDFTYAGNIWIEHTLAQKKRLRYLKLDVSQSLESSGTDSLRIREIEVRAGITNHYK